jgi:lysophospholipase L1-like esterase
MADRRSAARKSIASALAVAALALAGGACGSGDSDEEESLSDHLIVSIGDSVASGEGNPDRPARLAGLRPAGWRNLPCHRSLRSGHALAAMQVLGAGWPSGFRGLGCSGATIDVGLLGEYRGIEPPDNDALQPPQVDELERLSRTHSIDAVLLTVGANDVGFAGVVEFCVFHEACWDKPYDPAPHQPGPEVPLQQTVPATLERLSGDYDELADRLGDVVPAEKVIVVEYFDPTSAPPGAPVSAGVGGDCRMLFGGVSPAESRWARENLLQPLNELIAEKADEFGWQLVDGVDEKFAGHGLCAGSAHWVTTARESIFGLGIPLTGSLLLRQTYRGLLGSYKGTLHPNPAGHRATADLIAPVLATLISDRGSQ